ncbi:MAG TPA: hypothetical protein IAC19_09565 [Candidatus Ventricola gallistercoris]|nr:hypothetical protein [Candidatus Ventricola gallistercoris]
MKAIRDREAGKRLRGSRRFCMRSAKGRTALEKSAPYHFAYANEKGLHKEADRIRPGAGRQF